MPISAAGNIHHVPVCNSNVGLVTGRYVGAYSLMVEHVAHNDAVVGSTPAELNNIYFLRLTPINRREPPDPIPNSNCETVCCHMYWIFWETWFWST